MKSILLALMRTVTRVARDECGTGLLTDDKERRLREFLAGR